jgi:shikimate kinase
LVLAPGGGWITIPGVAALLQPQDVVVFLAVTPEAALARMGSLLATRPLLSSAADSLEALRRLSDERTPAYRAVADLTINTEVYDVQRITALIADWLSTLDRNSRMGRGR